MCSDATLSDKKMYPTFGRTFAVDTQIAPSLISLLKYTYNWNRVAIICQNATKWTSLKGFLVKELKKNMIEVATEFTTVNPAIYLEPSEQPFREALKDIKKKARSK